MILKELTGLRLKQGASAIVRTRVAAIFDNYRERIKGEAFKRAYALVGKSTAQLEEALAVGMYREHREVFVTAFMRLGVAVRVTASIGSPYRCAAADNPARWAEHVDRLGAMRFGNTTTTRRITERHGLLRQTSEHPARSDDYLALTGQSLSPLSSAGTRCANGGYSSTTMIGRIGCAASLTRLSNSAQVGWASRGAEGDRWSADLQHVTGGAAPSEVRPHDHLRL